MLAAAIAAAPACSTSSAPDDAGAGVDSAMVDAGAGLDTGSEADAGSAMDAAPDVFDAGTPLPPYGIPPMPDAGAPDAEDMPMPAYGAPPIPDAG